MKSFVKQHSLHVSDVSKTTSRIVTAVSSRHSSVRHPSSTITSFIGATLVKASEGVFINQPTSLTLSSQREEDQSPLASPISPFSNKESGPRTLHRQDTFDAGTSASEHDDSTFEYDTTSPQQSPQIRSRSFLHRNKSDPASQLLGVNVPVRRKRSKSEIIPKMAELYLPVPVCTVLTDSEDQATGNEEFSVKERTSKYRTSLKKAKKMQKATRKRAKSMAEENQTGEDSGQAPPPSPRSFRRKTSIFRGRNNSKENSVQRTQSVPNEMITDTDSLCVPTADGLSPSERKPSWSSFKATINSTLKSPRLALKSVGEDSDNLNKGKSFDDIIYGLRMEIAKSDDPVLFTKVLRLTTARLFKLSSHDMF